MAKAPQKTPAAAPVPATTPAADPSMAPQMPKGEAKPPKHHGHLGMWILGFVVCVLILTLVGVAFYFVQDASDSQIASNEAQTELAKLQTRLADAQADLEAKEMELEELESREQATNRQFESTSFSFDYMNGWHVYGTSSFDNPNRTAPEETATLNPDPIVSQSPFGGGYPNPFYFYVADEGEDLLAPYVSNDTQTVESQAISANGQDAVLLTVTPNPDLLPLPQTLQVLIVDDVKVVYAYRDPSEQSEAWDLIMNTIEVR